MKYIGNMNFHISAAASSVPLDVLKFGLNFI